MLDNEVMGQFRENIIVNNEKVEVREIHTFRTVPYYRCSRWNRRVPMMASLDLSFLRRLTTVS